MQLCQRHSNNLMPCLQHLPLWLHTKTARLRFQSLLTEWARWLPELGTVCALIAPWSTQLHHSKATVSTQLMVLHSRALLLKMQTISQNGRNSSFFDQHNHT